MGDSLVAKQMLAHLAGHGAGKMLNDQEIVRYLEMGNLTPAILA